MVLFIDACVRSGSRTRRLADYLLTRLGEPYREVRLVEHEFPKVDEEYIALREILVSAGSFGHPLLAPASEFAEAETIVIAAPYWDLSFPAMLKQYLEEVNVIGVTSVYSPEGEPLSLCRARRLFYVTTSGGFISKANHGFSYVRELAETFYNIPETVMFAAEGLDVVGGGADEALERAEAEIDGYFDGGSGL